MENLKIPFNLLQREPVKEGDEKNLSNLTELLEQCSLNSLILDGSILDPGVFSPTTFNIKQNHFGFLDLNTIDKKTCGYCKMRFHSRNALFRHLREMGVNTESPFNFYNKNNKKNNKNNKKDKNRFSSQYCCGQTFCAKRTFDEMIGSSLLSLIRKKRLNKLVKPTIFTNVPDGVN